MIKSFFVNEEPRTQNMRCPILASASIFLIGAAVLVVGITVAPPAIIAGVIILAISGCVGIMSAIRVKTKVKSNIVAK